MRAYRPGVRDAGGCLQPLLHHPHPHTPSEPPDGDVSVRNMGSWLLLLQTVLLGCTEERLTRAESDTNVKQTLINMFV